MPLACVLGIAHPPRGASSSSEDRSLVDQSLHAREGATTTNGDGFGVGWYDEGETPRLYRTTHPAWNDRNSRGFLAAGIRSPSSQAHPRLDRHGDSGDEHASLPARTLALDAQRAHPRVSAPAPRAALAVDDSLLSSMRCTTDLEAMFYLAALTFGLEHDPVAAVEQMVRFVEETGRMHGVQDPIQMTVATTDGRTIWAFRYSSEERLARSTSAPAWMP